MASGRITVTLARTVFALVLVVVVGVVAGLARSNAAPEGEPTPNDAAGTAAAAPVEAAGQTTDTLPATIPESARPATVTSITDGDTLRVDTGAGNEPVRLLELDTPEVTGDCGASQATDALSRLAPVGSRLWLEADVEDRDRYGRLLRYLWRDDGTMVNEVLVSQGWARATLYPPNERYWPVMQQAEEKARERDAGLWKRCGWATAAHQKPDRNSAADPPVPPDSTSCDPNYSGCVPPHPPDVDCSRVDGPVTVLGYDVHHLDGDGDGRACEPAPS